MTLKKRFSLITFCLLLFCTLIVLSIIRRYDVTIEYLEKQVPMTIKATACQVLSILYTSDKLIADSLIANYHHGKIPNTFQPIISRSWNEFKKQGIILISYSSPDTFTFPPFIYSSDNTCNKELIERFRIDSLINKNGEFETIKEIGTWVGCLWDHGADPLPKNAKLMSAVELATLGRAHTKLWCEVAAIMTVKTFSSLHWPARLVTLSRFGYDYSHGVAEVWSNHFKKWIMVDADFNLIYIDDSIPLSAFELCHKYDNGSKNLPDTIQLGRPKPSLPFINLLPYFNYVAIDLRNDWETRKLRSGSPVGGSLSTWWTCRIHKLEYIWPGKKISLLKQFDWQINRVYFFPDKIDFQNGSNCLKIQLNTYAPYFQHFEISIDKGDWRYCNSSINWSVQDGMHTFRSRVITTGPFPGPVDSCVIEVQSHSP